MSGIKLHIGVDTNGLPHAMCVTTANVSDRNGAIEMLEMCAPNLSNVAKALCDGGYTGENFALAIEHLIMLKSCLRPVIGSDKMSIIKTGSLRGAEMAKKSIAAVSVLLILLLNSCTAASEADTGSEQPFDTTPVQTESAGNASAPSDTDFIGEGTGSTQQPDTTPSQTEPAGSSRAPSAALSYPPYPLYFPMPYYSAFLGTQASESAHNIDAFLHDTAVNYVCARMGANEGGLILISLRLLDEWDAGDGARYYLCRMREYYYYDLDEQLLNGADLNDYVAKGTGTGVGSGGGLIRFKVFSYVENPNVISFWGFSSVEILEQPDWGTDGGTVEELCGGRPIAEALLEAEQWIISDSDVPFVRDILPCEYTGDMFEYLNKYLEVFFPEFL